MSGALRAFYGGRRVLVTGHTGMKGAWLALWLRRLGAEVSGIALPPNAPLGICQATGLTQAVSTEYVDIRELGLVSRAMARIQPEIVFHLAAQSIVGLSYEQPVETFATNVLGSVHVLEAVRATPSVRAVVMVTSDKCYDNVGQSRGYREGDPLGGDDPYSASKAAAEQAIRGWIKSFFAEAPAACVASARAGNVVGGGDWSMFRLVPDCIRALREGRAIPLRNPGFTRPWQFVLEPLFGYLLLARRLYASREASGAWNFGPPDESGLTVGQCTEYVLEAWGGGRIEEVPQLFREHRSLIVDSARAHQLLGWRTVLPVREALAWATAWYRTQFEQGDGSMLEASLEQIEAFERRLDG